MLPNSRRTPDTVTIPPGPIESTSNSYRVFGGESNYCTIFIHYDFDDVISVKDQTKFEFQFIHRKSKHFRQANKRSKTAALRTSDSEPLRHFFGFTLFPVVNFVLSRSTSKSGFYHKSTIDFIDDNLRHRIDSTKSKQVESIARRTRRRTIAKGMLPSSGNFSISSMLVEQTNASHSNNGSSAPIRATSYDRIIIGHTTSSTDYSDFTTISMSQMLLVPTSDPTGTIAATAATVSTTDTAPTTTTVNGSVTTSCTVNGTGDGINSFYFYETEQFAVLWVLFTVIVLGNSAVLVTLFMNKNRKSRMNFFIKQLAIADLFVGLLNVLTDIIWRITVTWRAGNLACKIIRFLQVCVTYASTYVLVALSIDRYDAITHPMNFSGSWQRARRLVALAWTVSALFSAPMLYLYEEKMIDCQAQCWIELGRPWRWQLYMSLVAATLFAFPALIISACYAIIVRTIWVKGAVFVPTEHANGCINPASRRASSRGIIPRAKVKTVKMTFVIVIVFVLCWSPYIIFDLLQVFEQIPRTQTNIAIATFIQSLAPLNSAANPLIYCLFSTQVCRALKRIPPLRWLLNTCCFCCDQTYRRRNSSAVRCTAVGQRRLHHNSCDSMRTFTTSLTVSRRSNNNCMRPARVVIVERPKTILAMSEV